jgi:ABC-type phosphate transport system substrate-binding protein
MAIFAVNVTAKADVVVIVSSNSSVTQLTTKQTAKIFLGKEKYFPDEADAIPIDQPEGSSIRNEFYSKIVHKTPMQLQAYWARIFFTGDGHPPVRRESDLEVRNAVANNPRAIGYIDKSFVDDSVRVILKP